jgi:hypothetical protein
LHSDPIEGAQGSGRERRKLREPIDEEVGHEVRQSARARGDQP